MPATDLSPMQRQYREIKARYPGVLLLFRLGDFYEMFEEDAEIAAKALELTLTSREFGKGKRVPMCGIPYHALDRYLPRLVRRGLRAAICEQVEDAKQAKGLVDREVVRVVTPGTLTEEQLLDARANNFLVALADAPRAAAVAVVDVSTGEFRVTELRGGDSEQRLLEELERLQPAEVLWPASMQAPPALQERIAQRTGAQITVVEPGDLPTDPAAERLCRHFGVDSLRGFDLHDRPLAAEAAASALRYVRETQLNTLPHIVSLRCYETGDHMPLDAATRRNLELTATLREGAPGRGTLVWLLDETCTPMGGRRLRDWLVRPLTDPARINERLDAVEAIHGDVLLREDLRAELKRVADLERLVSKASTGRALPRDLAALRDSLARLPELRRLLAEAPAPRLTALAGDVADLRALHERLTGALVDDPPAQLKDGGVIRSGHHPELDELREAATQGKDWIAALQRRERQRTGIDSLKVGYNQVFGYYLEVTRPNLERVPEEYIRKQTLANAERFISPELKEWEHKILGAEERLSELEARLFGELREAVADEAAALLGTAQALAEADVYAALAVVAAERRFVRPTVDRSDRIAIRGGRHPIVEATQTEVPFVPNDTDLDTEQIQIQIVTGPNMAGKSTYLRQVALLVLLAQIGCFVPADSAHIGTVDRIFTRIGAQDDLATGQSTFMVEMTEAANILHNATRRSLVILDEIGRGTSTYDGLSIAWAIVEYLHDPERAGAKTLFATHYHYLNELADRLERVHNYRVAVAEEAGTVRFLHRIEPGGTDRSYGVEVARLAGLPVWVVRRARQVLSSLETRGEDRAAVPDAPDDEPVQLALFGDRGPHPVVSALRELDVLRLTPIEAINRLFELQQMAHEDE